MACIAILYRHIYASYWPSLGSLYSSQILYTLVKTCSKSLRENSKEPIKRLKIYERRHRINFGLYFSCFQVINIKACGNYTSMLINIGNNICCRQSYLLQLIVRIVIIKRNNHYLLQITIDVGHFNGLFRMAKHMQYKLGYLLTEAAADINIHIFLAKMIA